MSLYRSEEKQVITDLCRGHNTMKTCNTCKLSKEIADFSNDRTKKDGKSTQCKACKKAYKLANAEKLALDRKDYYDRTRDERLAYAKQYREKNPEKVRASTEKWRKNNPEHVLDYSRNYRKDNPKQVIAATRKWREKNVDKEKAYRCENSHKLVANTVRYRARKIQATPKWADNEVDKIIRVYAEAKKRNVHVDHIVPLQSELVCGLHTWANLQLLDVSDNTSKGNRYWPDHPDE